MAYRLPSERRDRAHDSYAPSYLDDFLDQIEPLQASTKTKYAEIRAMDDRINTLLTDADAAADEAIRRATTRGAIDSVRRQYQEFIHMQTSALELADKKITLAVQAESAVEGHIADLEKKLDEFEAQLRKEGRWPGSSPPATVRTPRLLRAQPDKSLPPTTPDLPPVRPHKSRSRREAVPANPATPRAAALAAARATAAAAAAAAAAAKTKTKAIAEKIDPEGDVVMVGTSDATESKAEPVLSAADQAALDTMPYCHCRKPSHGDMVACEAKGCKFEWYHFECVGLTKPPEGTWICDICKAKKKKTGSRRR